MFLTALAATFTVSLGTSFLGFLVDSFDSSFIELNLTTTTATTAGSADTTTTTATTAGSADTATTATTAGSADTATTATTAGSADTTTTTATTAGSADTATTATTAGSAWVAARLAARASAAIADLLSFLDLDADQSEMPQGEFEDLLWACTLPDYAKAASDLLARPKPQRGARGRFVKKVRPQPDLTQNEGQVDGEPVAPIPPVFSFFKGLYQPTINILIHITQQFNNTYPLPT